MRKKRLLAWLAIAGAAAGAAALAPSDTSPLQQDASRAAVPSGNAAAHVRFAALPEREPIGMQRGEVFAARSWAAEDPPASFSAPAAAAAAPAAPPAGSPVLPYRVAGRIVNADGAHVVLAKGDAVLAVREGDSLDGGYRVEEVAPDHVTLLYVPLGVRESLPVVATLALDAPPARVALQAQPQSPAPVASRPAQLRWDGPHEVRAGDTFNVVLKVTSAQPVRASPLQLSFDAKLLEPLGVRAGGFFADGLFSYRVNPAGSIFVGAAGKGAVASDAEFVVVTFRSIRGGTTAELKLSSLVLQGAAGRAIVHDQPAVFRTTIMQ